MIKPTGTKVYVKDGNVEKALRKLKKKVQRNNTLQEVKERQNYVQPSQKRKTAKEAAKRRWAKHVRSQELPVKPRGKW
jgi:small subunit ribosomal protein S21